MTGRERCLAALAGRPVDRVPVFPLLMFLSADRLGVSYREYATNGRAMAESQLKVREIFHLDAITACSDAFRIAADLGGDMVYPDNGVPHLRVPLVAGSADLSGLRRPDPARPGSRMADRTRAVGEMARGAGDTCMVLGWVDHPFAEACSLCGLSSFMLLLTDDPALAHRILGFLAGIVVDFALAQLDAGAPMIGAGDAAASLLSPAMYREFALPYEQRVFAAIRARGGLGKLHICGNTAHLLDDITRAGADLYNVDHMVDFDSARAAYAAAGLCFKGNLDPVADILHASPEACARSARRCVEKARGARYMLSAGCEIPAAVPDETLRAFCGAAGAP
jgi:MtaA/CmuA family methyltransferase